jgi:hypothetical protein
MILDLFSSSKMAKELIYTSSNKEVQGSPSQIVHAQFDGRNKIEQNEIFFMTAMLAGESGTSASQTLEYKSTLDQQTTVAGYVRTRRKETYER